MTASCCVKAAQLLNASSSAAPVCACVPPACWWRSLCLAAGPSSTLGFLAGNNWSLGMLERCVSTMYFVLEKAVQ